MLITSVKRQVVTFRIAMISCYKQARGHLSFGSIKIVIRFSLLRRLRKSDLSFPVDFRLSCGLLSLPTPALSGSGNMGMISARQVGHPFEIMSQS